MGILKRLWRRNGRRSADERRELLLRFGRITEGRILDSQTTATGQELVFFVYCINGVDFESSELLTEEQVRKPAQYSPGATVSVRFDPKNHGNSIIV